MCIDHFRKNRVFIYGVVGLFCMSAYPEVWAATTTVAAPSPSFQEEQTDPAALARHAAARADYWRGIYWTAKGDARKAVAYWRKAAVAGDAAAEFNSTYLLLQNSPDWRWLLDRDDTPWYPGMRLFRQIKAGVWDDVLASVAESVRSLSAARR